MPNEEEITWQLIRGKLLKNIDSSGEYPYAEDYIPNIEALIDSYDGNQLIQDLLVKYAKKCQQLGWAITIPELWHDSYLFIGEGAPGNSAEKEFDPYLVFTPLKRDSYIGKPFRDCIHKVLPRQKASFANTYSCGTDLLLSKEFLTAIMSWPQWSWQGIISVGNKAEEMLRECKVAKFHKIYHPSYPIRIAELHQWDKMYYIQSIKKAINGK